jgi:hypothetical protein
MDPEDIRRWIDDQRAVAVRVEQADREKPLSADMAFRFALDLLVYDEKQNGSPFQRDDPVTRAEDERVRNAWAMLRQRWPNGGR